MELSKVQLYCLVYFSSLHLLTLKSDTAHVKESDVKEYFISRNGDERDKFSIVFNAVCQDDVCKSQEVSQWCAGLSASYSSLPGRRLSCACRYGLTFLPKLGQCVNRSTVVSHFKSSGHAGGCAHYFDSGDWKWFPSVLKTIDIERNGTVEVSKEVNNCEVMKGSLMYYSYGNRPNWQSANSSMLSFRNTSAGLNLTWTANTDKTLSGRIVHMKIKCTESQGRQVQSCLLLKTTGNVTYCRAGARFVYSSVCPGPVTESVPPSLTLLSLSLSISPSLSSLVTETTHRKTGASSASPLLQSQPITSVIQIPSSIHFASTPNSEVHVSEETLMVSQGTSSSVVGRSSSVPRVSPARPSMSLPVSTTTTFPPATQSPGSGAGAQSGDKDDAIIGGAVGGAVVFTAVIILVLVFCKRRGQKHTRDSKLSQEVKNPVYGRADNDIHLTTKTPRQTIPSSDQTNHPVYQSLTTGKGVKSEGQAYYNSPEDDYDNQPVYQSLEKQGEQKGTPVYQSLQKGPQESEYTYAQTPGPLGDQRNCSTGPVGPVRKGPGGSRASEDPMDNVPKDPEMIHDARDTQEPLYNVVEDDVSKSLLDSEADPTYDVLDSPDSGLGVKSEPNGLGSTQEPLYNVLEDVTPEDSHSVPDPLYNVLDGPDVSTYEPVRAGFLEVPVSRGLQNLSYELTEEFEKPQYASLEGPSPSHESLYQPLKGP